MGISTKLVARISMGVGSALSSLGQFLDECEERDAVSRVELSGIDGSEATVAATLVLEIDTCAPQSAPGFTPSDADIDSDGRLTVSFESTTPLLPVDDHDVAVEPTRVESAGDSGTVVELRATASTDTNTVSRTGSPTSEPSDTVTADDSTVSVTVGNADPGEDAGASSPGSTTSTRSRDVPPFRDTELLREVYETCDTFAEMPEALGMDVTAETVRRYMIRQGIHEPTSYNTNSEDASDGEGDDATDESDEDEITPQQSEDLEPPAVLADGIGLPDDVTIDTIVEAVQTSNTIYEVKQGIGIEREDALEMLRELNLLEFVAGRLATEAEREVSRDQIIDRLRQQADSL